MKNRSVIAISLILLMFALACFELPASAESSHQAYYFTPTAGSDGHIVYTVKDNDSCLSVALKNLVDPAQLSKLNNLTADECAQGATLAAGRQLLISVVTFTPTLPPTLTPTGPTPTAFLGYGTVCVTMFSDLNNDAKQDPGELAVQGGVVGVLPPGSSLPANPPYTYFVDPTNNQPASAITKAGNSPVCLKDLPEGEYTVAGIIPEGYTASTQLNTTLKIEAGETVMVSFGARPPATSKPTTTTSSGNGGIILVGGLILILVGIGLGVYYFLFARKR
jgi:LysM domain